VSLKFIITTLGVGERQR